MLGDLWKLFGNNGKNDGQGDDDDIHKQIPIKPVLLNNELEQGQLYLHDKDVIQAETAQKLRYLEGFNGSGSGKATDAELWAQDQPGKDSINAVAAKELAELKDMENKFQKVLSEYSNTYNLYMHDVMDYLKNEGSKYVGKTIQTPSGTKYYVNFAGEARQWSSTLWNARNPTCGIGDADIVRVGSDNIPSLGLKMGVPMKRGEPCGFGGKNIKVDKYSDVSKFIGCFKDEPNRAMGPEVGVMTYSECQQLARNKNMKYFAMQDGGPYKWERGQCFMSNDGYDKYGSMDNCQALKGGGQAGGPWGNAVYETSSTNKEAGKVGYVTNEGVLREYENGNIENVSGTCPTTITSVEESVWDAYTKGAEMTTDTLCALGNLDTAMKQKLVSLNNQLIQMSEDIYDKINATNQTIQQVSQQKGIEAESLNRQLGHFKSMFEEYNRLNKKTPTINAMMEDQLLKEDSSLITYSMWSVAAVGLIAVIMMRTRGGGSGN
jgi:hypothetical protein